MLIRRELPTEAATVYALTAAAFARAAEAVLVDALRADPGWLPGLSLVAEHDGTVVGHVLATRGHVDGAPVLGLGPLSVHPDHQNRGIGSALVHTLLGAADARDEPLVALLGEPAYYRRFGFRPSTDVGVQPPDPEWGRYFQVRTLSAYRPTLRGTFAYPEPFSAV